MGEQVFYRGEPTVSKKKHSDEKNKWDEFTAEQMVSDDAPSLESAAAETETLEFLSNEELRAQLLTAESKAADYMDQLLREKANNQNLLRRSRLDVEAERKFGLQKIMLELLAVLDNLERSLDACDTQDALKEGVELTLKSLQQTLKKFGLEEVEALGCLFDPHKHEAVSTQEQTDVPAGTVLVVLQKGYALHDRLIRPAMVVVSKAA